MVVVGWNVSLFMDNNTVVFKCFFESLDLLYLIEYIVSF